MTPTHLNIGCGTHRAPPPFWNIDLVENDNTHPDEVIPRGMPLPYADGSAEMVFLGHVLEHVEWPAVVPFLRDVARLLVPGGRVCVVSPDVHRTIHRWKQGREPWDLVESVLEHQHRADSDWPEAVHHWNCTEARVFHALEQAGYATVTALEITAEALADWPVVAMAPWQCAVEAVK